MSTNGIGFIASVIFLIVMAVWSNPDNPGQYIDLHGFVVVVVGTAVIAIISVPWRELKGFFAMLKAVTRNESDNEVEIISSFVMMAEKARTDISLLKQFIGKTADPFMSDALTLLVEGFDTEAIVKIMRRRLEVQKERENAHATMFKNLGKYPPACGLIGTVMGMIALLGTLGQEGAGAKIGPAMSVALAATLYGVIVANLVILPVADNLLFRTQKSIARRELIIEGILLLKQKKTPVMVRELLSSHVGPGKRELIKTNRSAA
jgi:chemotaxis protein MotA